MDHTEVVQSGDSYAQVPQPDFAAVGNGLSNRTSAGNSEASPRIRTPHDHEYDTPPDNIIEAVSPTSSRKRGLLRAASLGIGPHVARALRQVSPSPRSTTTRHIPRPIFTGALASKFQSSQQQESASPGGESGTYDGPAHGSQLDSGDAAPPMNLAQTLYRAAPELQTTDFYPRGCEPNSLTKEEMFEQPSRAPIDLNPYVHRADEIGPTHRIPGLGHLGNMLVPPGWKEGDEPIRPQEAQQLYDEARKEAQYALEKLKNDIDTLPKEEQDKRSEERDKEWSKQFKKDDLILRERIKIYDDYHERKQSRNQHLKLRSLGSFSNSGPLPLHTMQPPTSTSIPQYTEPLAPINFPLRSRSDLRPQSGEYGLEPTLASSTSYADPQSLDPSLLNQSVPAVYNRFQTSQFEIMRKKAETEQQFGSFLAQYSGLSNNSISPGLRSPLSGPQAGPFASVHTEYNEQSATVQPGYLPRPLPYISPTQPRFAHSKHTLPRISPLDRPRSIASSFPVGPEASRYPVSSLFRDNGGLDMPHPQNDPSGMIDAYPLRTRSDSEALTLDTSGASAQIIKPKKKRASRAKPVELKEKAWYYEDIKNANLPTSHISEEAEQAGEEFEIKQSRGVKAKKAVPPQKASVLKPQRRRGRKLSFDPAKGFPISAKAAEQLVKGGFIERQETVTSNTSFSSQVPPAIANGPDSQPPDSLQEQYPSSGPQANYIHPRRSTTALGHNLADSGVLSPTPNKEDEPATHDQDDEESDSGSEQGDDPHDKTFNAPSRRKAATSKQSAVRGRKRKLPANVPRVKRSRVSTEGDNHADIKVVDGSSDCTPVMSQRPREHQVAGFVSTKMPVPASEEPFEDSYGPSPPASSSQNFS